MSQGILLDEVFAGYMIGLAAAIVAIAKPFFLQNVGVVTINGKFHGAGFHLDLPPDAEAA